ncbi:MAG: sulfotransferase [Myxococcota bacterium]
MNASSSDTLFLLGGCDSSGTTLVASVLDGLHDLRTGPESWLFHHRSLFTADDFPRTLYGLLNNGGPAISMVVDKLRVSLQPGGFFPPREAYGFGTVDDEYDLWRGSPALEGFIAAVLSRRRGAGGGPVAWIDQTPANAISAREYLTRFPRRGRFIHVLRDGRDVVSSLVRRWTREAPDHPRDTYLVGGAVNWSWDVSQALRAQDLPGYLEVRYEAFVRDPVGQTNRILQHLGRPAVDEATFQANRARSRQRQMQWGDKPSWGATPDQPITDRSVGRWQLEIGVDLAKQLENIRFTIAEEGGRSYCFGDVLQATGYRTLSRSDREPWPNTSSSIGTR